MDMGGVLVRCPQGLTQRLHLTRESLTWWLHHDFRQGSPSSGDACIPSRNEGDLTGEGKLLWARKDREGHQGRSSLIWAIPLWKREEELREWVSWGGLELTMTSTVC